MEKSTLLTLLGIGIAGAGALVSSKQETIKIDSAVEKSTRGLNDRVTALEKIAIDHDARITKNASDIAQIHEAMSSWRD